MDKKTLLKKNIWLIFSLVFITSSVLFSGVTYYNWTLSTQTVLNKQQTHVELFGNSVRAFLKSQESLLEVLGVHLITQHQFPKNPIYDAVLDSTMETYPALLGLGLASYDGQALVVSSNFDLNRVPNLMELEMTRNSFMEARTSRKIHTGPTYIINALKTKSFAMPIRKAIYIPHDAPQAVAVMTAGIRLDNTPIFGGHTAEKGYHQVEIIRSDRYPVFTTSHNTLEYTKPVSDDYYSALEQHTGSDPYFSLFELDDPDSESVFQVVAHYDPYLDFWFVSKMDKQYIVELFTERFYLSFAIFILYNIIFFFLIRSISNNEQKRQQELLQLAHYDSLTGLPNRPQLFDVLGRAIISCSRNNDYHALLFLDIDDFKTINDTHGHEYGDMLLKQAASRIRQQIRAGDTLARFGGDEFVVLLPGLEKSYIDSATKAEHVAVKLLDSLSLTYQLKEHRYTSSASIGIVLFNDDSQAGSALLKQADIAMYRAKRSGKNAVCFFDPEMQKEVTAQFILEDELRTAMHKEQFELFYQPQVDRFNNTVGAEALIRWRHPEKGLISPYTFIPIAEKTGLIVPIGKWVLKTACKQLSVWQRRPETQHLSLSINVSYKQFCEPDFVSSVSQLIDEYCLDSRKIRLELTETMLVDEMELTIERMNQLCALGVNFSLDDFGTGYSSLKYLKKLPLSQLKIDKSFVDDLVSDKNDQSIVKTIISMSEALTLNTIAEGVETEEQRVYLDNEGCFLYQGYLYSQPLPIEQFDKKFTD